MGKRTKDMNVDERGTHNAKRRYKLERDKFWKPEKVLADRLRRNQKKKMLKYTDLVAYDRQK